MAATKQEMTTTSAQLADQREGISPMAGQQTQARCCYFAAQDIGKAGSRLWIQSTCTRKDATQLSTPVLALFPCGRDHPLAEFSSLRLDSSLAPSHAMDAQALSTAIPLKGLSFQYKYDSALECFFERPSTASARCTTKTCCTYLMRAVGGGCARAPLPCQRECGGSAGVARERCVRGATENPPWFWGLCMLPSTSLLYSTALPFRQNEHSVAGVTVTCSVPTQV